MKSTFSMLKGAPLLPIIQPKSVDEGLHLAEAIANSGLCNIEVVKRSDAAFEALSAIRKQFPELVVGMGTLLNRNHVFEALDAGAQFLITPTSSETLLDTLIASNALTSLLTTYVSLDDDNDDDDGDDDEYEYDVI